MGFEGSSGRGSSGRIELMSEGWKSEALESGIQA